jgi:hypothetical protein
VQILLLKLVKHNLTYRKAILAPGESKGVGQLDVSLVNIWLCLKDDVAGRRITGGISSGYKRRNLAVTKVRNNDLSKGLDK